MSCFKMYGFRAPPRNHSVSYSSLEDRDADLSPRHFATTHYPAERLIQFHPCYFATTHLSHDLTAGILNWYLPLTLGPMKWRTLSQRPLIACWQQEGTPSKLSFFLVSPSNSNNPCLPWGNAWRKTWSSDPEVMHGGFGLNFLFWPGEL